MKIILIALSLMSLVSCSRIAEITVRNNSDKIISKVRIGYKDDSWTYNMRNFKPQSLETVSQKRFEREPRGLKLYVSYEVHDDDFEKRFNLSDLQARKGFIISFTTLETKDGEIIEVHVDNLKN